MKANFVQKITFLSILSIFVIFACSAATPAKADIINPNNSATLSIQPVNPGANTPVTATITSYLLDLTRAKIVWSVNGAQKQNSIGDTTFSFTTGNLGKTTNLSVSLDAVDGTHVDQSLSIRPANVDLAWQASSYTPPFSKGKALYPPQGIVTVVALPDFLDGSGSPISSSKLLYKWSQDRQAEGSASGYGKNTYTFQGDMFARPIDVKVSVSSLDSNQTATNDIMITPTDPETLLYEDDPLFGIKYEKNIDGSYSLNSPEINVSAVPYFFNLGDNLSYAWSLNGNPFTGGESADGRSVTLRQSGSSGTALLSLSIKNNTSFLESASTQSSIVLPALSQTQTAAPSQ